jgi:ribosome-associated toxin RatA of RatAB toxin-antitoxin module
MRHVKRSALVALPPGCIYALINDIDSYPQFLPGCTAARVQSRTPGQIVATVSVRRGPLAAEFTTRNLLTPDRRVLMQLVQGPFRELEGEWLLTPVELPGGAPACGGTGAGLAGTDGHAAGAGGSGTSGTRVDLSLRFAFSNAFSAMVFGPLFEQTAAQLVDAFVARARALAGPASVG